MDEDTDLNLRYKNLAVNYKTRTRDVNAVRDVSFDIHQGENLGLVGESGCGKSTVAYSMSIFWAQTGGSPTAISSSKANHTAATIESELRKLRGADISMVYQEPMSALNPTMRIRDQLAESLMTHRGINKQDAYSEAVEALKTGLHARSRRGDAALPPPAFRRATAACGDRHGNAQQPFPADHGRAYHRTGCDRGSGGAGLDRRTERALSAPPRCISATTWAWWRASRIRWR